ncbi:hypothetical protein SCB71_02745 [Herbiconiux sp. KACC 21604]|uniref:hypothetical protein n=1 Tax=unclassified Herbiconiux TaxID=2618217 RepID=UPI001492A69E|nr:hypothetical protein [Herbiconiux sp. SALV-R1]QJU52187.1 hypothetical protein HL652_00725 [Herbiconiux sp. SALV-R1]WPO87174.1 hypothetical protein SCB71_02745 [Herbiconiux sp. KACC 21604]
MSFLGGSKDPFEPGKTERENLQKKAEEAEKGKNPNRPSNSRIAIWVIVGGVGLYLIGSGVWGILTH